MKRNQTSTLTFENTFLPPGKIVITKTTSDDKNLSGWQFGLYSEKACTNLLATATTNSSGEATFPSVEHGDVWVKELGNTKSSVTVLYECSSTNPQKVTVQRNKTSKVTFENELLPPGNVSIMKTTSDRKNLSGWQFNIYSDRTCTKLISGPHTSGSDGQIVVSDLNPGTIWVKEIGHTDPTITGYYTCVGYNPVKVTIMSNKTVEVHFRNDTVPDGSVHLIKTTNCGTGLNGWQFSLYSDHGCTKLVAGPYITDAKGTLDFPNLKPGVYWIKELGNEDPVKNELYICDSLNPQKVLIVSGRTSTVSFHNIILTGSITVSKTDPEGNTLPGAQFLLEWSNDGVNWKPVNYSDSLGIGTTSTQGVENGLQTTDEAGHISYAGLNPDLQYRLYEVKAPEGYQLLYDYVFQGKLTGSDLSVTVTAVNSPVYTLPLTGSNSMMDMSISIALCLLTCLFPIFYFRRKEN